MKILVTGGAGYIGSFMVKRLLQDNNEVVVYDSLERGHQEVVDQRAIFVKGNLLDRTAVFSLFEQYQFEAVIHFAGYISMAESMKDPGAYFLNNTFATEILLDTMIKKGVRRLIFSSTAGVYGNPLKVPIPENHQTFPTNPYGESKLMTEKLMQWYSQIFGLSYISLRYFNAAGGSFDGLTGEMHIPETHIIPLAILSILNNSEFTLFGDDYHTKDGTAIRDYIHVVDLVEAHILSLKKLLSADCAEIYNVGAGVGYSNKQVIAMIERISGSKLTMRIEKRREGDAEVLIADSSKIINELGFIPHYSSLETIVKTAWEWHKQNKG